VARDLRRFLETKGETGALPEELGLFRAARFLGVAPWELAAQSEYWLRWAEVAMRAPELFVEV
jgi:hypothetical protein